MAGNTPTPTGRAVGGEIRAAREAARISQRDLARRIGVDQSVLSRWESGQRPARPEDVERVLADLDVPIEDRERILRIAREPDGGSWLSVGTPEQPEQLAALLEFDRTCADIADVSMTVVPGLLQTGDYARAIIGDGTVPANEVATRVAVRMGRREVLHRENPVRMTALIGEAALRGNVGGPRVMTAQLKHLLSLPSNVEIGIVPLDAGWHRGLIGAFTFYSFGAASPIVYVEAGRSGLFLSEEPDIDFYRGVVAEVKELALSPELSIKYVSGLIDRMEKT